MYRMCEAWVRVPPECSLFFGKSCLRSCVVLCCFVFLSLFPEHLSIDVHVYTFVFMCAIPSIPYTCSRWLQPDRAVDPEASELDVPSDPVVTGLPSEFTVTTRDQDGKMVYVGDMKVRLIYREQHTMYALCKCT